jgi:biotin synthase
MSNPNPAAAQVIDTPLGPLTRSNLARWLRAEGEEQQELFALAREMRAAHAGNRVKLRGVIEVSNYCQRACDYCAMRPFNKELSRYRLSKEVILDSAAHVKQANIGTVFLQSGQDPKSDPILEEVIPQIRNELQQDVLLNVGEKPRQVYERFAALGAGSFILKFETSDPVLYAAIAHSPLEKRLRCLRWLKELGYKVGTGNIIGLPGQTTDTLVDDILLALDIQPDFVSSSPFIPNQHTPFEDVPYGDVDVALNSIAICRVLFPYALIPSVSALEKIRKGGQLMGLNAGANVMTINFTPEESRRKYAIYSEQRFVVSLEHATRAIEQAGLSPR